MKIIRVGVDLAKNVFQVHGVDRQEKPVWRRKLNRAEWLKVLLDTIEPGGEIGMEACGGAHHSCFRQHLSNSLNQQLCVVDQLQPPSCAFCRPTFPP